MNRYSMIPFIFLALSSAAHPDTRMEVGDGLIDGTRIKPYQLTWQQCSFQDNEWQNQGALTEELVVIGDDVVRHRQTTRRPDGTAIQSDTYFDRRSFAPLRMEMEANKDGTQLAYSERTLTSEGYSGIAVRGEETKTLQGIINSNMLHGGALGLPLAAMDYQAESVAFLASMVSFDGTYIVSATWAGKEAMEFDGQQLEAWLIDIEWEHRESGDIYPPGPNASGGRYWVVSNPPSGFPYVPRYKTDTYAVEFVSSVCPISTE